MTATKPDRKRRGSPEWIRLGEQLQARRGELDARYGGHGGRMAFARDRLPPTPVGNVNLKLVQDIELNGRENFTPLTQRDVIAPAYGVTYESVRAVLEGAGDLAAAPGTPPRRQPGRLQPAPDPAPREASAPSLIYLPQDRIAAARPFADAIYGRLLDLAGAQNVTGERLFGPGEDASTWDDPGLRANFTVQERVWMVAELQARRDARERGADSGTALAALAGNVPAAAEAGEA